jgi:23S rRNA (guanine745-N1)-methyltransferase
MNRRLATKEGDSKDMVDARRQFQATDNYEPVARQLVADIQHALENPSKKSLNLLDIGAGPGYYSAYIVSQLSQVTTISGLAMDNSPYALRRAAKVSRVIGAVQTDAWQTYPLPDSSIDICINVFAPRNPAEIARVLKPDGHLLIVTPSPGHLGQLVEEFGLLTIDASKDNRLESQLRQFKRINRASLNYSIELSPADTLNIIMMGPSARHINIEKLISDIGQEQKRTVTIAVNVDSYQTI